MVATKNRQAKQATEKDLKSRRWRLNNLYRIINEDSQEVVFKDRPIQEQFYNYMWYWNLILKARQPGITTKIDLFILDTCLFNSNIHAGIIAHDLKSAQRIFYHKVKYPYEHLPSELTNHVKAVKCDAMELRLSNGSSVWVGTSMRSATLRMLHISELAKICAKYPQKALEIKTGALPALHEGSYLFVESTAEGGAGDFHDMAIASQADTIKADKQGIKLNPQQIRFHFFAWYEHFLNSTDPTGINVSNDLNRYFVDMESKLNIKLTPEQKAWYALKKDGPAGYGKYMKREFPSTVEEAFEQSVEGAVYGEEMELARTEGRIGFYPWVQTEPVYTFWDLGYRHATAVMFAQFIKEQVRVIDFHSERGRGAAYHAGVVRSKDYVYADHFFPHDVMNHEKGSGIVLKDTYDSLLWPGENKTCRVVERPKLKVDGINAVSLCFNRIVFNEPTTRELCKALSFYRYEWDEDKVCFSKNPVDDWAADPADSMQTMAMQYRYSTIGGEMLGYPHAIPVNVGLSTPPQRYDRLRYGLVGKGA